MSSHENHFQHQPVRNTEENAADRKTSYSIKSWQIRQFGHILCAGESVATAIRQKFDARLFPVRATVFFER
jgi:hypothetical protein